MSIFRASRASNILLEQTALVEVELVPEKKRNLTNFQDAMDALLTDMKADDIKISTRDIDKSRLLTLNRIHGNKCEIQEELDRDPLDRKLTETDMNLSKLLEIGKELFRNIGTNQDIHENARIEADNKFVKELDETIKDMGTETLAEFDNIWTKWTELGELENHFELDEKLKSMKVEVEQLMAKKNIVITAAQVEYTRMRETYNKNLEQDEMDMILLIQRVQAAIDLINNVYKQQTDEFENKLHEQAQNLSEQNIKEMHEEWQNMLNKEDNFNKIMLNKHQSYIDKLKLITREEFEFTRSVNMRLEDEFLRLQSDIVKQKKEMLINAEKNDYNLQILEQRNYEQVIISNEQKRLVSRRLVQYQETKKKSKALKIELEQREQKLVDDVEKLHKSIPEWQRKLTEARFHNKMKFDKVWNMNFNKIIELTNTIMKTDKLLCEIVLQNNWEPPNIDFFNINSLPINPSIHSKSPRSLDIKKKPRISGQSKKSNKFNDSTANKTNNNHNTIDDDYDDNEERRIERKLMRTILQQISDRGGIFLESSLIKVLSPYDAKNQHLVRLDHIFKTLDIQNESLLKNLTDFFLPYTWCPNCSHGLPDKTIAELLRMPHERHTTQKSVEEISSPIAEKCINHHLVTEETFVLSIINKFASQVLTKRSRNIRKSRAESFLEESINLIKFDDKTIHDFFMKYLFYVKGSKLKYWKVLEHGFNHYLDILRKREQLFEETSKLEKENQELAYFLQHIVQI